MQTEMNLFLDVPLKKGWCSDVLNTVLGIQCVSSGLVGICIFSSPGRIRDYLTDSATSKCERLAGCGLTECLFQMIGTGLLCWSCLAFMGLSFRDVDAKISVAKFFLLHHIALAALLLKDRNAGVYNAAVYAGLVPLIAAICIVYIAVIRIVGQRKDLRGSDAKAYI